MIIEHQQQSFLVLAEGKTHDFADVLEIETSEVNNEAGFLCMDYKTHAHCFITKRELNYNLLEMVMQVQTW
jgi:hypothetical protein